MSDDFGERTHPPTERRRREARARGEVALSSELVAAGVLLVSMTALWWSGPLIGQELAAMLRHGLSSPFMSSPSIAVIQEQSNQFTRRLAICVLPLLLLGVSGAAATTLVQTGFLWTPARAVPQWERLDPTRRLRRLWSSSTWIALAELTVKHCVLVFALIAFLNSRLTRFQTLATGEPSELIELGATLMGELGLMLAFALFGFALLDYGIQFWLNEQRLKMTVEEVRREQREAETAPRWKQARRDLAGHRANTLRQDLHDTTSIEGVGPLR